MIKLNKSENKNELSGLQKYSSVFTILGVTWTFSTL